MRITLLLGILLGVGLCVLPGYSCTRAEATAPTPEAKPGPAPTPLGKWDDEIEQAKYDAAAAGGDRLKVLEAQKREADARAERSAAESKQWREVSGQKDVQIKAEHDRIEQVRLYWAAGIFLLLAIAAAVVAVWQPIVRHLAGGFAVACAAGAALCIFVAWLVPYLIWIGGVMSVIGIAAALIWWKRDSKALGQTVEAVGAAKARVPAFTDAYKAIFNGIIDSDADAHIMKVRGLVAAKIASEQTRLADAAHKLAAKV
jgi:hypothetical protein